MKKEKYINVNTELFVIWEFWFVLNFNLIVGTLFVWFVVLDGLDKSRIISSFLSNVDKVSDD